MKSTTGHVFDLWNAKQHAPGGDARRARLRQGPYRTEHLLGRSRTTVLHVARRVGAEDTGEQFVVKRILPEFAAERPFVETFYEEASLQSELEHPNIVRVVDFGEQEGELWLVTERVDAISCGRMLSLVAEQKQSIPIPVALEIIWEVLEALAYSHELARPGGARPGIVHRRVSPENILIGFGGEVKLTDFAVADRPGFAGCLEGKLGYMSPEQIDGLALDSRSDLFSLAVVAFEMLTGTRFSKDGERPEHALSPLSAARASMLPFELRLILATALVRDRRERFQDAQEFLAALRDFARHAGIVIDRRAVVDWFRETDFESLETGVGPMDSGIYSVCRSDTAMDTSDQDAV